MNFKKIGTIGRGSIVIKAGYVGVRGVITLTREGAHILSMNHTAAKGLISHLRAAIRVLEHWGIDEDPEEVKPESEKDKT